MKPLLVGIVFCAFFALGVQATAVAALWALFFYAVATGIALRWRGPQPVH